MIKRKKKDCVSCGEERYIWSKGRCKLCSQKAYKKPKQVSEKKKSAKEKQTNRRNKYFDYHIERCTHCEESGVSISEPNRSNILHLFAKSNHPSVEDNLDNYAYMTVKSHTKFDNLLFKHRFEELEKEFPNSWKIIIERMKKLLPVVQEQTRFKIKFEEYLETLK